MPTKPIGLSITLLFAAMLSLKLTAGVSSEEVKQFQHSLSKATAGDMHAQEIIALSFEQGSGVKPDFAQAAQWFRKAAEQGSLLSQFSLGVYFSKGQGVPKDDNEAAQWFRSAALRGHPNSQIKLGEYHEAGKGIIKDDVEAYALYNLASISHPDGPIKRERLENRISREETAAGQKRSRELMSEIEANKAKEAKK